jgi:hypothetical protein
VADLRAALEAALRNKKENSTLHWEDDALIRFALVAIDNMACRCHCAVHGYGCGCAEQTCVRDGTCASHVALDALARDLGAQQ